MTQKYEPSEHSWPTKLWAVQKVKKYIKKGKLLDLGVNGGDVIQKIGFEGLDAVGIDIDDGALELARSRGIKVVKHDLNYPIQFKDREFDNIIAIESFEHVANYMGLLRECYRLLKPDCYLIIVVPYHGPLKNVIVSIVQPRHFHNNAHVHFYNPKLLKEDAESVGFKAVEVDYYGRMPYVWKVFSLVLKK